MDYISFLIAHFSDINFIILDRMYENIVNNKVSTHLEQSSTKYLYKELERLNKEYKNAKISFKKGKITYQELNQFEERIIELEEEIKKIENSNI